MAEVCDSSGASEKNIIIEILNHGYIQFDNGVVYSSDGSNSIDWKHTIVQSHIINKANNSYRVLKAESSHITGSGLLGHIILIKCERDKLNIIFQKTYIGGVDIKISNNGEIAVVSGEWEKSDPNCCPSKERVSIYNLNDETNELQQIKTYLREIRN